MAGSASNWFKPSSGPLKGQSVYLSKAQQGQVMALMRARVGAAPTARDGQHSLVGRMLEQGATMTSPSGRLAQGLANTSLPAGVAKARIPSGPSRRPAGELDVARAMPELGPIVRQFPSRRAFMDAGKGDQALDVIYRLQGFHNKPRVADAATVDRIVADGARELFRGVGEAGSMSASDIQDAMRTGDRHYPGFGIYGNGSYFAGSGVNETRAGALRTAHAYSNRSSGSVIRSALDRDARIGDFDTLKKAMASEGAALAMQADARSGRAVQAQYQRVSRYLAQIKRLSAEQDALRTKTGKPPTGAKNQKAIAFTQLQRRIDRIAARRTREEARARRANGAGDLRDQKVALYEDVGRYAAAKGYDAIHVAENDYVVVLNRSALTIQDTDPSA